MQPLHHALSCALMLISFLFAVAQLGINRAQAEPSLMARLAAATGYMDPAIESRVFRSRSKMIYSEPAVVEEDRMPSVLQGGPALYSEDAPGAYGSDQDCPDEYLESYAYAQAHRPCRWGLNLWIAGTDGRMNRDAESGIAEGAGLRYFITDQLAAFAGIGFNHFDGNHQTLGTIGIERFGSACGSWVNHITAMAYWDKYEGALSDSTHQFRFRAGYVITDAIEVGAVFTAGSGTSRILPFGSNATAFVGSNYQGGYAAFRTRFVDLCLMAGNSDSEFSGQSQGLYGIQARVPVTGRVGVFAGYMYGDRNDDYFFNAGVEFVLGRGDRRRY